MIKEYNRTKAVEYAQKWALTHNPQFYYFGGIGGDCTNFISQCLLAGGGIMNYDYINGWFYNSINNRSASWTGVAYLQRFLLREAKTTGPFASVRDVSKLEIGDIIQLRQNNSHFNHTLIISQINNGIIYVCAHSDEAKNRPLQDYNYIQTLGLHIQGIQT